MNNIRILPVAILLMLSIFGCNDQKQKAERTDDITLDSTLQAFVDTTMRSQMETIGAYEGQVIVMEVKTGAIKAMVGYKDTGEGLRQADIFAHQQEMGSLAKVASLLAAMETGRIKLTDEVETYGGVYHIDGQIIRDHNWRRGGYGLLTNEQALEYSSNIAICRALQKAFVMNVKKYFAMLDAMSYGQPDSITGIAGLRPSVYSSPKDSDWVNSRFLWHAIGYERVMAPVQMLTFYNAIANGGKMVKPVLHLSDTAVINEQIASKENIKEMQLALHHVVSQGLGRKAETDKTTTSGKTGTAQIYYSEADGEESLYHLSFCGYFPSEDPQYSIIVSLNKKGLPASGGGMAGPVFRQTVEFICDRKSK
ncbi:MAG: penicillin-binding protein [Prevotella sp.]|nr:penicillin-binding protein [Prevotella sp.]